ncbi:serine/threonine protein kinase, AGC [Orbilia ellipsospora]|uniref:cAMP-dependent protein kinase n=1 Tax=Orbilia ellipsospora TaxID=2528407 RepID=A0AAV9XFC6_9PEZI
MTSTTTSTSTTPLPLSGFLPVAATHVLRSSPSSTTSPSSGSYSDTPKTAPIPSAHAAGISTSTSNLSSNNNSNLSNNYNHNHNTSNSGISNSGVSQQQQAANTTNLNPNCNSYFMSNPLVLSPQVSANCSAALRDFHLTDSNSGNNSPAASSDTYFDEDSMEIEMTMEDSFGSGKMDVTPHAHTTAATIPRDGSTTALLPPQKILTIINARNTAESRNACPSLDAHQFELLRTLGTGTFARVWLVRPKKEHRTSGTEFYALKVLKKKDVVKLKQVEHVLNERMLLSVSRPQPFIVDLFASWSDRENLYMLLEYSPGGEVFTYLRKMRRFNHIQTQFYIASVTLILEFLHDRGIVYRDLKPENILLDARGHVKLVDFGFAKSIGSQETYTLCGTPEYLSPEVIQSRGHTTAVDWWALGILTYEFLCGFPPFYDNSPFAIYEKIVQGRISFPAALDETTRDFISRLCEADLSSRLGNLVNGARDVKNHSFFFGIDWKALAEQRMNGPLVPELSFPGDTRYFDEYPQPSPDFEPYRPSEHPQEEEFFKDF